MDADRAIATCLLDAELWFRQAENATHTDPERLGKLLAKVFQCDELLKECRFANARACAALRTLDDLRTKMTALNKYCERLEAQLMRLAEESTPGVKRPALLAESFAEPAANGAYRASPTGASGESHAGEVPVGPGVAATAVRAEISRTGGVARRPTDIPNAESVETAGPAPIAGRIGARA